MKFTLLLFFVVTGLSLQAAQIDTISVHSAAMQKDIRTVVISPDQYDALAEIPVVYLLHGYGGNHRYWADRVPELQQLVDQYGILVVCPDGNIGSWYWDSPIDPAYKYETFVAGELIDAIDQQYKTIQHRNGRAITGLSMGGHGALYLAIKHQDVFSAAGSMAGGVDIRPFPNNWQMARRLGTYAENPAHWEEHTVINLLHLIKPQSLALMIDCGVDDFFYQANEKLHEKLLYHNIPHTYMTGPGKHDIAYWGRSVHYQMQFFAHHFTDIQK